MTDITLEQRAAHVATLGEMFQQCANDRRMIEADAALRLSAGADWQPIETAPKDGSVIIGGGGGHSAAMRFDEKFAWVHYGGYPAFFQPTHWQPLPAAAPKPEDS